MKLPFLHLFALGAALSTVCSVQGQVFSGNGNSGFGGAVGQGNISFTSNGTNLSTNFTRGPGQFDNILVIYFDTQAGGFADTSTLADAADGGRSAVSGFRNNGIDRSTLTFPNGFQADYALAIGSTFAAAFQLSAGGNNSLTFSGSPINPVLGGSNSASFTFDLALSAIGGQGLPSINFVTTYLSDSAFRSPESLANDIAIPAGQGWNPASVATFNTIAVPEPMTIALVAAGLGGMMFLRRRK